MSQYNENDPQLDELLAEPPVWPKVIGIISIVWGSLGVFCAGCGVIGGVVGVQALQANPEVGELPPTMQFGPLDYIVGGVGLLLAILLIIAGIMLVMRNPVGKILHLGYAVFSIVVSVASSVNTLQKMEAMNQWVKDNPDSMFAGPGSSGPAAFAGAIFGIALGIAYPLFLLIWFVLVKPKSSDIAGRGLPPAA